MTDRGTTGMPLLSGPAPPHDSSRADTSCRKCNKEFNIVFTRARKCNHCGYSYCSSCSDYQALLPREGSGYDPVHVCAFCIENLTITAGGRNYLRSLSLTRLKKYVNAYNITTDGVLEKDDLIEKIIAARGQNGCLPHANESFYRKYSVPNGRTGRPRGLFSRRDEPRPVQPNPPRQQPPSPTTAFPRPDLEPSRQETSPPPLHRTTPRPPDPPPAQPRSQPYPPPHTTPPPMPTSRTPSNDSASNPRPNSFNPTPGRDSMPNNGSWAHPSNTHVSAPPPPPPPIPSLDELLSMSDEQVSKMSISALKTILFHNHVNARLLLEKSDLVERVHALLGDERQERAREAAIHAREEEAHQHAMMEEQRLKEEQAHRERESKNDAQRSESKPSPPPMMGTAADLERNGLCVVCQDEEANIAVVDCGHLAMCRSCSDLIMSSSRECPLCRTRIVTDARLLRIFKT